MVARGLSRRARRDLLGAVHQQDLSAFVSLFEYLVRTKEGGPAAVGRVIASMPSGAEEDIVSAYDRLRAEWQAEYEARGKAEGRRLTVAKQLQLKFGALSDEVRARLEAADEATLELWTERVLFATTLEQIFAV